MVSAPTTSTTTRSLNRQVAVAAAVLSTGQVGHVKSYPRKFQVSTFECLPLVGKLTPRGGLEM